MSNKYTPSVNIVRDQKLNLAYTITPNATKVVGQITDLYRKGFRSYNIIGSYGSGKSSFLWAFEKSLLKEQTFFKVDAIRQKHIEIINIVGEYASLREILAEKLHLGEASSISDDILIELAIQLKSHNSLTVLVIDEFGKLLEYAVKNDSNSEIYFLQQLAELFNNQAFNGILITTLHQSFEAYSQSISDAERNEWVKVKGRFKDLTFNEPIEQLLYLASERINNPSKEETKKSASILRLQSDYHITSLPKDFPEEVAAKLWPFDVISVHLLCVALQRYGQNERSLFTFLESEVDNLLKKQSSNSRIGIIELYDYLYHEFYSYLNSKYNTDYTAWALIQQGLERIDSDIEENKLAAEDSLKVIGFITLFGHKGAHIEREFLIGYLSYLYQPDLLSSVLDQLEQKKILRYNRFSRSLKITEGSDLNIESELIQVSNEIDAKLDIVHRLKEYFDFSVINAKSITHITGTPRFFQYEISEKPLSQLKNREYQIDGVINLVFDSSLNKNELIERSKGTDDFIYASFQKSDDIRETIFDIEKTEKVITKNQDDKVAIKELESIRSSQKALLTHKVLNGLYTSDVEWYYKGKKVTINSKKDLYKQISDICKIIYSSTPIYRNELINRHHISGSIANSKKIYFERLVNDFDKEDLNLSKDHFPAEKTIYLSLLRQTGIHIKKGTSYTLQQPNDESFQELWNYSESFLRSAKSERKTIEEFYRHLQQKPFKLAMGFMDFWIPTFLFIKRDDFALFGKEEGYLPDLNETLLYLFTRNANKYEVKAFDVEGVKLDLYNKYRELLQLKDVAKVDNHSLIESIRPFLVFYKDLNQYTQKTKRLSQEALGIRSTIQKTQDPEKLFFEEFPRVLKVDIKEILKSDQHLEDYVDKLRKVIRELRTSFDELLNRLESFVVQELLVRKNLSFIDYKDLITKRYANLKEHMLLPKQKSLLIRLRTPLDDRASWLNSICQVVLGKSLDSITDKEETDLKEKIRTYFNELDNLVSITNTQYSDEEEVIKIQLTSLKEGLKEKNVILPKKALEEMKAKKDLIIELLGNNKKMNLYLLSTLLKEQLDD